MRDVNRLKSSRVFRFLGRLLNKRAAVSWKVPFSKGTWSLIESEERNSLHKKDDVSKMMFTCTVHTCTSWEAFHSWSYDTQSVFSNVKLMSFVRVCQITPITQKRWALRLFKILFSIFFRSSASNIGRKVLPDLAPLT